MNEQLLISVLVLLGDKPLSTLDGLGETIMTSWNSAISDANVVGTDTTGTEMSNVVITAPAATKAKFLANLWSMTNEEHEESSLDVEMARIMEETDRQNGVRPALAKLFGWISAGFSVAVGLAIVYRWVRFGEVPGWDILLIAQYIPTHVTLSYFHIRSSDKQLQAAILSKGGIAPKSGKLDMFMALLKK